MARHARTAAARAVGGRLCPRGGAGCWFHPRRSARAGGRRRRRGVHQLRAPGGGELQLSRRCWRRDRGRWPRASWLGRGIGGVRDLTASARARRLGDDTRCPPLEHDVTAAWLAELAACATAKPPVLGVWPVRSVTPARGAVRFADGRSRRCAGRGYSAGDMTTRRRGGAARVRVKRLRACGARAARRRRHAR